MPTKEPVPPPVKIPVYPKTVSGHIPTSPPPPIKK